MIHDQGWLPLFQCLPLSISPVTGHMKTPKIFSTGGSSDAVWVDFLFRAIKATGIGAKVKKE